MHYVIRIFNKLILSGFESNYCTNYFSRMGPIFYVYFQLNLEIL